MTLNIAVIERLKELRQSLLSEKVVMWDEVNAVERDLKFLLGKDELPTEISQKEKKPHQSRLFFQAKIASGEESHCNSCIAP